MPFSNHRWSRTRLDDTEPEDLRVWFGESVPLSLPCRKTHRPKSKEAYGDMAMLEIDKSLLYEPTGGGLKALGLDRQKSLELRSLPRKSELAMKGYPLERGQIDYALQTLTNRAYH